MPTPFPRPSHLNTGRVLFACLLVIAASSRSTAQTDATLADGVPYASQGAGRIRLGNTPLRIWHSTRGYAQEEAETAFGGRLATDIGAGIAFVDGQFRMSNTSDFGLNVGGGFRWRHTGLLTGDPRIFGVSGWYDGDETNLKNYFGQGGVSLESLGEKVDFRVNANLPGDRLQLSDVATVGDVAFTGNQLSQTTLTAADLGLRHINFEMAVRVPDVNLWTDASGYTLQGQGFSTNGYKLGFRGYVYNDLAMDLGVSDDDTFGT
ncbi:MAG: hypothetical protein KDA61_02055, partial [Planctomycetales bacterium]|nr:hypothetical protein [Planctomycetales bacterium]